MLFFPFQFFILYLSLPAELFFTLDICFFFQLVHKLFGIIYSNCRRRIKLRSCCSPLARSALKASLSLNRKGRQSAAFIYSFVPAFSLLIHRILFAAMRNTSAGNSFAGEWRISFRQPSKSRGLSLRAMGLR